jgi:hypothetical protein
VVSLPWRYPATSDSPPGLFCAQTVSGSEEVVPVRTSIRVLPAGVAGR